MTSPELPRLFVALTVLASVLASGHLGATTNPPAAAGATAPGDLALPAETTHVTGLRRGHAYRYYVEGDSFRRGERIDAASLALPSPVLEEARGTYMKIDTPAGPMWLERIQLVLDRTKQVQAKCPPGLSQRPDVRIAGVSGVGEGC